MDFRVKFPEYKTALRLCETPVLFIVPGIEFKVNHKIGWLKIPFGELVLVRAVIPFGTVNGLWGRHIVLNDIAQLDGRECITVLDARLDMDQSFTNRIITLHGIGQQVLKNLAAISILKKIYCIGHCRFKFFR